MSFHMQLLNYLLVLEELALLALDSIRPHLIVSNPSTLETQPFLLKAHPLYDDAHHYQKLHISPPSLHNVAVSNTGHSETRENASEISHLISISEASRNSAIPRRQNLNKSKTTDLSIPTSVENPAL